MAATRNGSPRLLRRIRILIVLAGWVASQGLYAGPPETRLIESQRAVRLPDDPHLWYDLRELEVEGKGWQDTEQFYDRLPVRAKGVVRDEVWELAQDTAGMAARFVTDATTICARWALRSEPLALDHMPATGVSGLDLYVRETSGKWRWLAQGRPSQIALNQKTLVENLPAGMKEFLLYLPLYNGVNSVQIGLPSEARIGKAPPRPQGRQKPICFYGTSITQGGCASRPGTAYTAMVGRQLDCPVVNLGFSGNGPMELEVGRFMTELDPAIFVLDCLPNMTVQQVVERTALFVKMLRNARPHTPIMLVENIVYQDAAYLAARRQSYISKNQALREAYEQLILGGEKHLFYLRGEHLLGEDGEATVDGTHPTDLGFWRMATAFEPAIRQALGR
jgi:hypothetical protein